MIERGSERSESSPMLPEVCWNRSFIMLCVFRLWYNAVSAECRASGIYGMHSAYPQPVHKKHSLSVGQHFEALPLRFFAVSLILIFSRNASAERNQH